MGISSKINSNVILKKPFLSKDGSFFESKKNNPMLHASCLWKITSEQLEDLLGATIYTQWFSQLRPLVIANRTLVLQAKNQFAAQWINTNYQELLDALIKVQDKKLSCCVIVNKHQKRPLRV